MDEIEIITGDITVLVASSNNNTFENKCFESSINVPYKEEIEEIKLMDAHTAGDSVRSAKGYSMTFNDCVFKERVTITSDNNESCVLTFVNCVFEKDIIGEDAVLDGKVRFRNCRFKGNVNFRNTTFNNLVDFWRSTFEKRTIFYKTDFNDIVVLSAVNFKENVLFTYSLIDKLLVLRGTYPEKGFDLSLAIIAGELSVFDFKFDNYNSHKNLYKVVRKELKKAKDKSYQEVYESVYEQAVSVNGEIPLENQRETHRIIKNQLISQKNVIDAVPFKVKESKALLVESFQKLRGAHTLTRPLSNIFVLSLNAVSNWFGSSYIMGALFTILIAALCFNLSISYTEYAADAFNLSSIGEGIKNYLIFINPTHKFDYLGDHVISGAFTKSGFYIYDFLGRIFVGYGIYQTIQAFRKYR